MDCIEVGELDRLPNDTLYWVMSFLHHNDLVSLCCVSKEWGVSKYARSDEIWKKKYDYFEKNRFSVSNILEKEEMKRHDEEKSFYGKYRVLKITNALHNGFVDQKRILINSFQKKSDVKVTIIGEDAVGKTSLAITCHNTFSRKDGYDYFPDDYVPNVYEAHDGCEMCIPYCENVVRMKLVDTAGAEEYERFRIQSYPGTDIFIIAFSLVDPTSLENAITIFYPEMKEYNRKNGKTTPFVLVGTKLDDREDCHVTCGLRMRDQLIETVSFETGRKKAMELNAVAYYECSARTQKGLKEVFVNVVGLVMDERVKSINGLYQKRKKEKCVVM